MDALSNIVNKMVRGRGAAEEMLGFLSRLGVPIYRKLTDELSPTTLSYPYNDVRRYGAVGDGVTDDTAALQNAFDSSVSNGARKIIFPPGLIYAFSSQLTIPAGLEVDFNGSTLLKTTSDATDNYQIEIGNNALIRNLIFNLPAGIQIERGINMTAGCRGYNLKITSVDQQNNLGSDQRSGLNINGDETEVDGAIVQNFDKSIRFEESSGGTLRNIQIQSYVTGIKVDNCSNYSIINYICRIKSPNGTTNPGHNGIQVDDSDRALLANIHVADSGEHGIYYSVAGGNFQHIAFSNIHIDRPGQSGLKLSGAISGGPNPGRLQGITVAGLYVVDAHFGNAPQSNEDGLRIEQCDDVHVTGYMCGVDQVASGAFAGVYIRDSKRVTIDSPRIDVPDNHGIHITDEGAGETIEEVFIRNPIIFGGVNSVLIDVNTVGSAIRHVYITDAVLVGAGQFAVNLNTRDAVILQALHISGWVSGAGTGVLNNPNGVSDQLFRLDLKKPTGEEVVTGTVDATPHIERTQMDSGGGAVSLTLPDALLPGTRKIITHSGDNPSTVTVTTHENGPSEVFNTSGVDHFIFEWTGIHWATVSSSTDPTLDTGIYNPVATHDTNVSASNPQEAKFFRIGDLVTVSGRLTIDPTATGNTILLLSLPISSNFASIDDCSGVFASNTESGSSGGIFADGASDNASFQYQATTAVNTSFLYTFTYRVLP